MSAPLPPQYFKCCKLLKIDSDSIQLVMDNWPTCMMVYEAHQTFLSMTN